MAGAAPAATDNDASFYAAQIGESGTAIQKLDRDTASLGVAMRERASPAKTRPNAPNSEPTSKSQTADQAEASWVTQLGRAEAPGAEPRCIIWVDRHLHKTGGTTVREVMRRWHQLNQVQHIPGWSYSIKDWKGLLKRVSNLTKPDCGSLRGARFAVELHEFAPTGTRWFEAEWMPPLRALRQNPDACCQVLLSTRVRTPLDHYISFFRWGVESRRSSTLEQWAPRSLQSVELLWGPYKAWLDGNLNPAAKGWFASYGALEHKRSVAMLESDFDVVYPSERFDDGMELIAKKLGLAEWAFNATKRVRPVAPGWHTTSGKVDEFKKAKSIANPRTCANMTRCEDLIRVVGAWDQLLHEQVERRFEKKYMQEAGEAFVPSSLAPARETSIPKASPSFGEYLFPQLKS